VDFLARLTALAKPDSQRMNPISIDDGERKSISMRRAAIFSIWMAKLDAKFVAVRKESCVVDFDEDTSHWVPNVSPVEFVVIMRLDKAGSTL
jgi:hypothetical protein